MRSIASGIRFDADLSCEFEGHAFSIKASDDVIVIEIPDLTAGLRLFRKLSRLNQLHFDREELDTWLAMLESTLEIRVGGICVATAGHGNVSLLGRLFQFKGLRLLPAAALRSVLRGHR